MTHLRSTTLASFSPACVLLALLLAACPAPSSDPPDGGDAGLDGSIPDGGSPDGALPDGGDDGGLPDAGADAGTDGGTAYLPDPPIFFSSFGLSYTGPVADQGDTWVEFTVADPAGLASLEASGGWSYFAANHRYVNLELQGSEFDYPLEVGDVIRVHGSTYPGINDIQKSDNNPAVWDVVSTEPFGPSFKHGMLWLETADGTILDAVSYVTNLNQTDWMTEAALTAAEEVVTQGQWPGTAEADALRIADVDRDWPRLRDPYQEGSAPESWQIVGSTLETYYERAVGLTGAPLKAMLNTIIRDHVSVPYSEVAGIFYATDVDPADPSAVIQFYTGRSTGADFNKEHVWAKSHGGFGYDSYDGYSDLHSLRPTRPDVNSIRWHLDFAEGGTPYSDSGCNIVPGYSFEPPDRVKGEVARTLFYMAVRYEGDLEDTPMPDLELIEVIPSLLGSDGLPDNNQHMSTPMMGVLSQVLQWHVDDPPDAEELRRNEVIFRDYQRNRNPFVDHPEWVHEIWGGPVWP